MASSKEVFARNFIKNIPLKLNNDKWHDKWLNYNDFEAESERRVLQRIRNVCTEIRKMSEESDQPGMFCKSDEHSQLEYGGLRDAMRYVCEDSSGDEEEGLSLRKKFKSQEKWMPDMFFYSDKEKYVTGKCCWCEEESDEEGDEEDKDSSDEEADNVGEKEKEKEKKEDDEALRKSSEIENLMEPVRPLFSRVETNYIVLLSLLGGETVKEEKKKEDEKPHKSYLLTLMWNMHDLLPSEVEFCLECIQKVVPKAFYQPIWRAIMVRSCAFPPKLREMFSPYQIPDSMRYEKMDFDLMVQEQGKTVVRNIYHDHCACNDCNAGCYVDSYKC